MCVFLCVSFIVQCNEHLLLHFPSTWAQCVLDIPWGYLYPGSSVLHDRNMRLEETLWGIGSIPLLLQAAVPYIQAPSENKFCCLPPLDFWAWMHPRLLHAACAVILCWPRGKELAKGFTFCLLWQLEFPFHYLWQNDFPSLMVLIVIFSFLP